MNFFDEATLRLKQQLNVTQDRDVAEALGFSPTAWAGRKKRGTFPESELYALAAKRPELGLDVAYVLTGITSAAQALLDAKQRRIAAQVQAGATLDQVRDTEAAYAPESLGALVALLEQCNAVERAALHTLLTSMLARRK